jgi:hypothetical protein
LSAAEQATNGGLQYRAKFSWNNPNTTFVYVPLSDTRNFLEGPARRGPQQPPEFFAGGPNGGSGFYEVDFDGNKLTWVLVTNSENSNTTSTSSPSAFASSPRCAPSGASAPSETLNSLLDETTNGKVQVYPNPVSSRLTISGGSRLLKPSDVAVFDLQGKRYPLNGFRQVTSQKLELDMSTLSSGIYMIRVQTGESIQTFRIIRQ